MSILNIDFDSAVEPTSAPAGRYELQVTACDVTKTSDRSKTPGQPQLKITIGFPENPEYQNFSHYMGVPGAGDDAKAINWKALGIKRFYVAFGLPMPRSGEFDLEQASMDVVGARGNVEVGVGEPTDDGRTFNNLKLPPIRN